MWALCDIAMHTIYTKVSNYDTRDFAQDARIPSMYYQAQPEGFQNTRIYIPPDMYSSYNSGISNTKKTGIVIPVIFIVDSSSETSANVDQLKNQKLCLST